MDKVPVQLITPSKPVTPERPISPRLIYRWNPSMASSLLHRMTGIALFLFLPFCLCVLIHFSKGEESFTKAINVLNHPFSSLVLLSILFSTVYHLINGLRFVLIDKNIGVEIKAAKASALATLALSLILTLVIFFI